MLFNLLKGYSTSILGLIFTYTLVNKRRVGLTRLIMSGKKKQYFYNKKRFVYGFNTEDENVYAIRELRMPHLKLLGLKIDGTLKSEFSSRIFKGENDSIKMKDNSERLIEGIKNNEEFEEINKILNNI